MSATAVLVPVLEPEAEALVTGGAERDEAAAAVLARAKALRPRVARVDAIREELHGLLFPKWQGAKDRGPGFVQSIASYFRKREPAKASRGYDPFVHLFGRSLPVAAPDSKLVADRLAKLLALDDAAFDAALGQELALLDPAARTLWAQTSAVEVPGIEAAVSGQLALLDEAMGTTPPAFPKALDVLVRLSAWSNPVWRFDGEMLPDLLRTLNIGVELGGAVEPFEGIADAHPEWERALSKLPLALGSFAGAGAWISSTQVRLIAGTLRLQRRRLADNASYTEHPSLVMRHVRLLEEAIFFCEEQGLALSEAAGVEWHERPR